MKEANGAELATILADYGHGAIPGLVEAVTERLAFMIGAWESMTPVESLLESSRGAEAVRAMCDSILAMEPPSSLALIQDLNTYATGSSHLFGSVDACAAWSQSPPGFRAKHILAMNGAFDTIVWYESGRCSSTEQLSKELDSTEVQELAKTMAVMVRVRRGASHCTSPS